MKAKAIVLAIITMTFATASSQVAAQGLDPYIGGQVYYIDVDSGRPGNPDSDRNVGLSGYLGIPFNPSVNLELQLFINDINTQDGFRKDIYEIGANVDLVYQWGNRDMFTPFVLGGLGIIRNQMGDNTRSNHTTGYGNLGLGFVLMPFESRNRYGIRFRGETRYAHNTISGGQDDWQLRLGLEIPLGRTIKETVEVERIVEKEVHVPAPAPEPVQPRAPDDDGDGVNNNADVCPNTLPNTPVDATGCAVGLREIRRITFTTDTAHLTPNSKMLLDMLARALKGQPDLTVQIVGHTDSVGAAAYNQQLSVRRAQSVRNYLVNKGVQPARFSTSAVGESQPAVSNETAEGRELNRRAEILISL